MKGRNFQKLLYQDIVFRHCVCFLFFLDVFWKNQILVAVFSVMYVLKPVFFGAMHLYIYDFSENCAQYM